MAPDSAQSPLMLAVPVPGFRARSAEILCGMFGRQFEAARLKEVPESSAGVFGPGVVRERKKLKELASEHKGATKQHRMLAWLELGPPTNSTFFGSLHESFVGALPGVVVHDRSRAILEKDFGFTPENTLFGASICPDEINWERQNMAVVMKEYWGECFPLGGISGVPFVGKTGFKAFSHHVPENGNVFVLFGPHVAVSDEGQVGKYLREGQSNLSSSCGAVIGAYNNCRKPDYKPNSDEADLQMGYIEKHLAPYCAQIGKQASPMAALAYRAYEMVNAGIDKIANTDFGPGCLVLLGGIQINVPSPYNDHFLPLRFEVLRKGQNKQDLLPLLANPAAWESAGPTSELAAEQVVFCRYSWSPMPTSPMFRTLQRVFPGALPGQVVHHRARAALELPRFGFTPENTLFGTSCCPDEINTDRPSNLINLLTTYWGEIFPLGGLAGLPFGGKTGFAAFSHHVPESGNVFVLFGPHVGISEKGELGMIQRPGQPCDSTACGAMIGAYNALKSGTFDRQTTDEFIQQSTTTDDFNMDDVQMAYIKRELAPFVDSLKDDENPMAALQYKAYDIVKRKIDKVVNTGFGDGYLVLLGGIQINLPAPEQEHFLPLTFTAVRRGEPVQDLLDTFKFPSLTPDDSMMTPRRISEAHAAMLK